MNKDNIFVFPSPQPLHVSVEFAKSLLGEHPSLRPTPSQHWRLQLGHQSFDVRVTEVSDNDKITFVNLDTDTDFVLSFADFLQAQPKLLPRRMGE